MLHFLITRLYMGVGTFFRMVKTLVMRQIIGIKTYLYQLTNFSRVASQAATATVQGATKTAKPAKREDYFKIGQILVSKGLVLRIIVAILLLGALIYFVVWPFVLSRFLTARFFREDKRVPEWTGQVIVYADKNKTVPLYAGRLEKGKLQGKGEAYDENGNLIYRGDFEEGKRTGKGICWVDGDIIYDGELVDGVYQGFGKRYKNGSLVYTGEFDAGKYQGAGKLFDASGQRSYEGSFEKNIPEGQGKSYDKTGRLIYEGSYVSGKYDGKGILYPAGGGRLEAEFSQGKPIGTIRWYRDGRLYYEGEWADEHPVGFGRLSDKAGRAIFEGNFACGTIDGASLLGMKTETLRDILGEKRTESSIDAAGGFRLTAPELGLSAQCTLQSEAGDSEVYSVSLFHPASGDDWLGLLPGENGVDLSGWGKGGEQKTGSRSVGSEGLLPAGIYRTITRVSDGTALVEVYEKTGTKAVLVEWRRADKAAVESADLTQPEEPEEPSTMEQLVSALDKMASAGAVRLQSEENPYYGTGDASGVISASGSPEKAGQLIESMTDYWLQAQMQDTYEKQHLRVSALYEEVRQAVELGEKRNGELLELEKRMLTLTKQIDGCVAARKEIQLKAESLADPALYDLSRVPVVFDPSSLDVQELSQVAAAYAQMRTGESTQNTDMQIKTMLLALQDDWTAVNTAKEIYTMSLNTSRTAGGSFSLGKATKSEWYTALDACSDADLALKTAVAAFEKQANALNQILAGWLSRNCGWHSEELAPVYAGLAEELERASQKAAEEAKADGADADSAESQTTTAEEAPEEHTEPADETAVEHTQSAEEQENATPSSGENKAEQTENEAQTQNASNGAAEQSAA